MSPDPNLPSWAPHEPSQAPHGKDRFLHRACFRLQVRPDRLVEYRARHTAVWLQMRAALIQAGWHNYSLFLGQDGLLIGYVETADGIAAAQARMALTDVNARWQAEMNDFFEGLGDRAPDEGFDLLAEIFHLEDQLTADTTTQNGLTDGS